VILGLSKDTIVKVQDMSNRSQYPHWSNSPADCLQVIAIVAEQKELEFTRWPKNMYIEDVAEFARVLLATSEMTFDCCSCRFSLGMKNSGFLEHVRLLTVRYADKKKEGNSYSLFC
jgi:hypothetical protein